MPNKAKPSRKPNISQEELLRSVIASFKIEGILVSMEEAKALLHKVQISLGKQIG
ncbi:MAG: hypothetical protein IPP83_15120 [Flavobacteriales bacterium]|nr:hypothetical protein [Flavobacteriales bacterium]